MLRVSQYLKDVISPLLNLHIEYNPNKNIVFKKIQREIDTKVYIEKMNIKQ